MIVISLLEGAQIGTTLGLHFANSAVSTMWDKVHHCVFWDLCVCVCVCVFALVFASNVVVVKVRFLLVWQSLQNRSLKNYCCSEGE